MEGVLKIQGGRGSIKELCKIMQFIKPSAHTWFSV